MSIIGRKIDYTIDSPIDNYILYIIEYVAPLFNLLNITPNILTTISLLLSINGIYHVSINNYKYGAILTFIGYMFDCSDGYIARRYNQGSEFGDIYDHTSDIFKMIFLVIMIIKSTINYRTKVIFMVIFCIFMMLSNAYLGCVELYQPTNCILAPLKMLVPDKSYIIYLRYTGTGTFFMIISTFIYNMYLIDNIII